MTLKNALRELKNRGDTVLLAEVEALEKVLNSEKAPSKPVAHRLLAHAAKLLREENPNYALAHTYLGAAVEAYVQEKEGESVQISASVVSVLPPMGAPESAFTAGGDYLEAPEDHSEFAEASQETISTLANVLLNGGYIEEARKYLTAYNMSQEPQDEDNEMKISQREALASLKAKLKKKGDLVRARALEEILADLDEEQPKVCKSELMEDEAKAIADDAKRAEAEKACYLMKAAEEMLKDPTADQSKAASMMKAAEDMMAKAKECAPGEEPCEGAEDEELPMDADAASKDELAVDEASAEELEAQSAAEAATKEGDIVSATKYLHKAERLRATRTIAALLKKGDFELAREGLAALASEEAAAPKPEAAEDHEKNAGMTSEDEPKHEDAEEEDMKLPQAAQEAVDSDKDEGAMAEAMFRRIRSLARAGNFKAALATAKRLEKLEKEVARALKNVHSMDRKQVTASERLSLVKEGRSLLAGIHWLSLNGQKVIAEELADQELAAEIADAMDKVDEESIEDTLDSEPMVEDDAPLADDEMAYEPSDEEKEEHHEEAPEEHHHEEEAPAAAPEEKKEEAEAMHYEVLQSVETLNKPMSRDALAFTFWSDENDPYWVVQAAGKPVAEVHLADQDHAEDVAAFFCDEVKWPNVVAQTVEKVGLVKMLTGVKARFYANAVTKGTLAGKMKEEALASLAGERKERLAAIRNDFTEAMVVAAESLNKGLLADKPNALKKAFVERLASLGIHNPALIVEECFAEAFEPFLDQVVVDANEYLEMPKEAFAMTKKMVSAASNVARTQVSSFANETLRDRLARTSMPLAPTEPAYEAPAAEREVRAALDSMSAREHNKAMRSRLQLSRKF